MEDRTYIEALMTAPARPEYDYTAQEAAAQRAEEIRATFKQINETCQRVAAELSTIWQGITRALAPIFRFFRRLIRRLVHHFKPLLPRKYKVRARPRSISHKRAAIYMRKMERFAL